MPTQTSEREYSYQVWTFNAAEHQAQNANFPNIETIKALSEKFIEKIRLEIDPDPQGHFHENLFWIFRLNRPIENNQMESKKMVIRRGNWIYFNVHDGHWTIFDQDKNVVKEILRGKLYLPVDDKTLFKVWDRVFSRLANHLFDFEDIATWE